MLIYLSMIDNEADKEKFKRLYLEYKLPMYGVAYKILRNHSDAEDALHEAFCKLAKNLHSVNEESGQTTKYYLIVIVRNVALTMLDKQKSKPSVPFDSINESADDAASVSETIEFNESYNETIQAINSLSKEHSEVLILKFVQGYSTHMIAKTLEISENSVYKRISTAKVALARILNRKVD